MKKCDSKAPINLTLNLIGGKWKPFILWLLNSGPKRYSELLKDLSPITTKMLTQQLRELEQSGLINRKLFAQVPPKVEYSLSPSGKTVVPILELMHHWGESYLEKNFDKG